MENLEQKLPEVQVIDLGAQTDQQLADAHQDTKQKEEHKIVDLAKIDAEEEEEFKDAVAPPEYDLEEARQLKAKANEEFKFEKYDECLRLYEQAIRICPPEETQDLAIFFNNRGICLTKLNKPKDAKKEFTKAIELKADYVKPRAFRMKLLKDEEEYDQALEDAKKILELEPDYPDIHRTLRDLERLQKEKFEKMKNEVVGGLKTLGNSILGKFGMSLDNFKMMQNPDGTYNIQYQNQ